MDVKRFWENRLNKGIDLRATGHRAFDLEYNRWLYQAQFDVLDLAIEQFGIQTEGASYLDVGSGGGAFIQYFGDKGCRPIQGLDITHSSVEHLNTIYPQHSFIQADISAIDFDTNPKYDLVSAISVLYHIVEGKRFELAVSNMCRMLSPGGTLILCDALKKPLLPEPRHVRKRSLAEYEAVFRLEGVEVLGTIPLYYTLNRVAVPYIGPRVISALKLGRALYALDHKLRSRQTRAFANLSFLAARKK